MAFLFPRAQQSSNPTPRHQTHPTTEADNTKYAESLANRSINCQAHTTTHLQHPFLSMHYLNHAACGPMSNATLQTIHSHLVKEQQYGGYGAAKQAQEDIANVYQKIAHAIHTSPSNIALTQGNSDGWTRIIHSMDWSQGGRILVANNEWGGNLGTLMQLHTQFGVKIEAIPSHADGMVDIDALNSQLQVPTNLVALTWFSSNSPLIQPAEAIGQVCSQYKTPLLIDAAQAMGQWAIDVQSLQCAALTAPGRKWLRGPRGTGFAYIHPDFLPSLHPISADHFSRPWQTNNTWTYRNDARRLELSEAPIALRLGLGTAIDTWSQLGISHVQSQIQLRATWLRDALRRLPHLNVHKPQHPHLSGIVTFECLSQPNTAIHAHLQQQAIEMALCPAAFTPWDMNHKNQTSTLRFSPSHDTPWESLQFTLETIKALLTH